MARATANHGPLSPSEVDGLDLSVIAALLGVGGADSVQRQAEDLVRRRMAAAQRGERFTWDDASP